MFSIVKLLLIVVISLMPLTALAQNQQENERLTNRTTYLPNIQTDLSEPSEVPDQSGSWRRGVKIHTEFYEFQPHYTLEVGATNTESCTELRMWNVVTRKYILVTDGHWRDYPDNPDVWGPQYFQLTKSWIASHLLEALRPGFYWGWCK